MILDLFFVLPHLMLHLVQSGVEYRGNVIPRFARHQIVAMFGIDEYLDIDAIVRKIDRNIDRGDAVEKSQQLFSLANNVFMRTWTQSTVSAGDGDLHRNLLFLTNLKRILLPIK